MTRGLVGVVVVVMLTLGLAIGPLREAVAGACVCEIPCKKGCCKWCEIWSPDMISALNQAAEQNIQSVGESVSATIALVEGRILVAWGAGMSLWAEEILRSSGGRRVIHEGVIAVDAQLAAQERAGDAATNAVLPAEMFTTYTNAALLHEQFAVQRAKTTANVNSIMAGARLASIEDPASVVIGRHKPYCTPVDVERGFCDSPATDGMQNADLIAGMAFDPGEGQYETYADAEREAAIAFARNIITPLPNAPLPRPLAGSPQAKLYEAQALADEAALSVAAHSLAAKIAHRTRRHQK